MKSLFQPRKIETCPCNKIQRLEAANIPQLTRRNISAELAGLKVLAWLSALATASFVSPGRCQAESRRIHQSKFLVYYGSGSEDQIFGYDLAALDSNINIDLRLRLPKGPTTFLGYLSLGEVHQGRDYFEDLSRQSLFLGRNPNWPDAHFIDMRSDVWCEQLLNRVIPSILARGFDGILFDTLDNAEALEQQDPIRYAGMVEGAARTVRAIRNRFPGIPIMINRGYAVLPHIVGQFDMLLGESVRTTFDFGSSGYRTVDADGYQWQLTRMREAHERDPRLRLFSLDYWDPKDEAGIARIYAAQRANGFIPYVATHDLTQIVAEP